MIPGLIDLGRVSAGIEVHVTFPGGGVLVGVDRNAGVTVLNRL